MNKVLTCIICPRGCTLTVTPNGDSLLVTGNSCPKGRQYALEECTHPIRTVTSVIRVQNRPHTMVSVKTEQPVPKSKIFEVMQQIRSAAATAPVEIGDVLLSNLCGTRVVATKRVE